MVSYVPSTPHPGVLVDSGCTSHIFSQKNQFVKWDDGYNKEDYKIILANGSQYDIAGKGQVDIHTKNTDGEIVKITLNECLYFPQLKYPGIY